MTQAQRDAIREEIQRWTAEATTSKKAAREHLFRSGFLTKDGKDAPAYGGKADKAA